MTVLSTLRSEIKTDLPRADTPKTRNCLRCTSIFTSEWSGERICPRCKSSRAWKDGIPFPSRSSGPSR